MDIYIYYTVRSTLADAFAAQVREMQASLAARYGVRTALKRRPVEKDGWHTWMEVYLAVPEGFELALDEAVTQSKLTALIDGARHTEYFQDLSSCA